jgi:hypothetical protein
MAIGAKTFETRSWATSYCGPLLILATKKFPREAIELCFTEPFASTLHEAGYRTPGDLPRGALVCKVELAKCIPTASDGLGLVNLSISPKERAFGDYSRGRYGWETHNVERFAEPIPWKGSQGLFDVAVEETT